MLADPKSSALVDNLAGEWLGSRELAVKQVTLTDVTFDDALRAAMAAEASLFLGEMLRGGHADQGAAGRRLPVRERSPRGALRPRRRRHAGQRAREAAAHRRPARRPAS